MPSIILTQNGTSLSLPVVQPGGQVSSDQNNTSVNVNAVGETTLQGKRNLRQISYTSFFPYHVGDFGSTMTPTAYTELIERFKRTGTVKLHYLGILTIDATIESFTYSEDDGTRDVTYSITFKEYIPPRTITYKPVATKTTAKAATKTAAKKATVKKKVTAKAGRVRKKVKTGKSYTVKKSDSLSTIAKRIYGQADWKKIYNANRKTVINPNRLQAGMKLVIK